MKKTLSMALALLLAGSLAAGCGQSGGSSQTSSSTPGGQTGSSQAETENRFEKKIVFSASSVDVDSNVSYFDEARYKKLNEMFNFEIEFVPVSWDTWAERDRIWINSGDMPDVMFWDFNYNDYVKYTEQGVLKALPEDYAQRYPNLASVLSKTGVEEKLKAVNDGQLYVIPNVTYQNLPTSLPIDSNVAFYRKDWAKAIGFDVGETITMDELCELAGQMIEKDPGGNGAGKTIGITGAPYNLYHSFVRPFNDNFDKIYNNGTEYVYGPFDSKTLDGLQNMKKILSTGVIDPDFYTIKGIEYRDKFFAGKAGVMLDGCSVSHYASEFTAQFAEANPGMDPFECIGIAAVTDNDGVYHAQEVTNYWASSIFNADIDDEKMDRILSIFDYIATEEGQYLVYLGVEGEDYVKNGDQYEIKTNEDGSVPTSQMKNYFWTKPILPDDWALHDPTISEEKRNVVLDIFRAKEASMSVSRQDYDYTFLSTPEKANFSLNSGDAMTQVLLSGGDLAEEWNKWIESVRPKVQPVLDEVNQELLGK